MKPSRSLRVLKTYREKVAARPPSPLIRSGRVSFRVKDFTIKVSSRKKGRTIWQTLTPQTIYHPPRKVRIRRGENRGKLRRLPGRSSLSPRLLLPRSFSGQVRVFYKGKKVAETKLRKNAKSLTPRRLRRVLVGESVNPPKIQGTQSTPTRDILTTWDPVLGLLPQTAYWDRAKGILFNKASDLRKKRKRWRVWFLVEIPFGTTSPDSFKVNGYDRAEYENQSVFHLTFFVIDIDPMGAVAAADYIRRGPLFSQTAQSALEKHNEGDADHEWLRVAAFIGVEGLG